MFERLNRVLHQAGGGQAAGAGRQPTLQTLLPGDVVSFWDGGDGVALSALACEEELNGRATSWRWVLFDGGRVLEVAPEGTVLYTRTVVLHQASAPFEQLTSDPEQGGVLKAFEQHVREGTAARNPVLFSLDGKSYRMVATGVFSAKAVGGRTPAEKQYPSVEVWRDVDPARSSENVYFEMESDDEEGENVMLGIWTTHIALLFGKTLTDADVDSIYPRSEEETPR